MSSQKKRLNPSLLKKPPSDTVSSLKSNDKDEFHWQKWLVSPIVVFLILITVTSLLYYNTLDAEFHFDDYSYIVDMPNVEFGIDIRDLEGSFQKLLKEFYLPGKRLFYLTLALNYHFDQLARPNYRRVNILVHAINGCLVFILIRLLLKRWYQQPEITSPHDLTPDWLVLALALLFIAHPLAVNSVTYITQRTGALATLFYQASLITYLQFKENKKKRKWIWLGGACCFYWAAFQSKSMAMTLPLVVLCFELIENYRHPVIFKRWIKITIVGGFVFLIAVLWYAYKIRMFSPHSMDVGFNSPGLWSPWIHFLTESRVFIHYWRLLILPWPEWLSVNHGFVLSKGILEWQTLGALLFHVGILGGAGWCVKKGYRLAGLGIFWFYLTLSPPYLVLPQREIMVEYKTYLPSIGWWLIIGEVLWQNRNRVKWIVQVVGVGVVFLFFSGSTLLRNEIFQTNTSLWSDVLKKYPGNMRAYNNQATAYSRQKQYQEALKNYSEAIKAEPGYMKGYNNRGNVYYKLQQYDQALEDYNQMIRLIRTQPETIQSMYQYSLVYYQRGKTWMALKQYDQAIQDFNQFLKWNPQDTLSYLGRARALIEMKNYQAALKDYERAEQLEPNNAIIYSNRGNVYWLLKQFNQAIMEYNRALQLNPRHIPTYLNRGNTYFSLEQYQQAIQDYNQVLLLQPTHANASRLKKIALSRLKIPVKNAK